MRQPRLLRSIPSARAIATRRLALVALAVALAACSDSPQGADSAPLCDDPGSDPPATAPAAVAERPLPAWYDDAKLGIMVHWGVWAIPGWAETTLDPERVADPNDPDYLLAPGGVDRFLHHNPYSEWYENSLATQGTETQAYHREQYGADFPYTGFKPLFEAGLDGWSADAWAALFQAAGARYVVMVTKHHDGYALWPSEVENPHRPGWSAPRDLVGEVTHAVRRHCMRMGVYYSGGLDWSFKAPPITGVLDFVSPPPGQDYATYVDAQYRELIRRYRPSVLWNDITSPPLVDARQLFADYYAAVPDGVVDDRWGFDATLPHDFDTVEFNVKTEITPKKWEAVRGIGRTFGYNRAEPDADYGTSVKYIQLLIDVVSKGGNLLLNVGPMADGTIPEPQVAVLRGLGAWLRGSGDAIFGTHPWTRFAGRTDGGLEVRFTARAESATVYAIALGTPEGSSFVLESFPENVRAVRALDPPADLDWSREGAGLRIAAPRGGFPAAAATAVAIELAR